MIWQFFWVLGVCFKCTISARHSLYTALRSAGKWLNVKGIDVALYGLASEAMAPCSAAGASDPAQRCIYPDTLNGTWNVSLTYASDTLITLPHFLEVRML